MCHPVVHWTPNTYLLRKETSSIKKRDNVVPFERTQIPRALAVNVETTYVITPEQLRREIGVCRNISKHRIGVRIKSAHFPALVTALGL